MARHRIYDKKGQPTKFFWSDKHGDDKTRTVFKETTDGVKRMRGVHFDPGKKKLNKA